PAHANRPHPESARSEIALWEVAAQKRPPQSVLQIGSEILQPRRQGNPIGYRAQLFRGQGRSPNKRFAGSRRQEAVPYRSRRPSLTPTCSIPEHDQAASFGHSYPCFIPQLCPNGGGAARWEHRISPRLVAGPNRAVRTFRQIAIPRWEWSKRKLGIALLACPHAIAMGVSGILRGYPNALGWHQRKVPVYLAVYRAPR